MEGSQEQREKPQYMAWGGFGTSGHEGEYTLSLDQFNTDKPIPYTIEDSLRKELGEEWSVSNRGSRIEITGAKTYGKRDDEKVLGAIKKIITPLGYDFRNVSRG